MPGKTYVKTIIREIFGNFGRFSAMFWIVALGVGFLSGLLSTTPNMKTSMDLYFKRTNMMDIFIKATMGLTDEDYSALKGLDEVEHVLPAYVIDAMVRAGADDTLVTRIYGLPFDRYNEEDFVNRMDLAEGRFPIDDGECLVQAGGNYFSFIEIGTELTITGSPVSDNLDDVFAQTRYKVTGIVKSPLYIAMEREPSNTGSGRLGMVMFVSESCYSLPAYTDFYITLKGRDSYTGFTSPYGDFVKKALDKIESLGLERSLARQEELYAEAEEQLDKAEAEYEDGRALAARELAAARRELDRGAAELNAAEEELFNGEALLAEGRKFFEESRINAEKELAENEELLRNGTTEIAAAKKMLAESKQQLDDAASQVERIRGKWYVPLFRKMRNGIAEYDAGLASYNEGLKIVNEKERELQEGWAALNSGRQKANEEFALAELELGKRDDEIANGYAEIAEARARLREGEAEYAANLREITAKFLEGGEELLEARESLAGKIPLPKWYVLDRNANVGSMFYKANTEKISDVAKVFPVFFLLVAALVVLTTMTRMVEEERIQIGTFKALGYQKRTILAKYLVYCALTGVLGSIAGMAAGFRVLPAIIYNAFGTLYHLPPLVSDFYPNFGLIACGLILTCTMGATIYACFHTLWEKPAFLMIPRPPKSGKRIFLEHIPFIWKRMKFTHKVTARNLIRRKRHFFMTITGISGCTALMTAGFGLYDSVADIAKTQFEEIANYDLQLQLNEEDLSLPYLNTLNNWTQIHSESGYIINGNERFHLNIIVPEKTETFPDFITLRDRRTKNPIKLTDDDAILTEMIAEHFKLKPGDKFTIENSDGKEAVFTLSGITENYVGVTAYMGSRIYSREFGIEPSYTTILADTSFHDEKAQDSFTANILAEDNVMAAEFTSQIQRSFNNLLNSITFIVLVIVFASGALAIIVLYNLTNININERIREIATLRVLGFHKTEAAAYIFREIVILSILGVFAGLFLGLPLHRFITGVAENPNLMFGRRISTVSFMLSGIITLAFSALVDLFMLKKIGSIKMAESMKNE